MPNKAVNFFYFYSIISVILLIIVVTTSLSGIKKDSIHSAQNSYAAGRTFYVAKTGNNSDALTTQTAWNELDKINWSVVNPGDTIEIQSGTYSRALTISKDGTASNPIQIKANGRVEIFGGRSTPLPLCGQTTYSYQPASAQAIILRNRSNISIDGQNWRGISIHGFNGYSTIPMDNTNNITLRNIELYDNGGAEVRSGKWYPSDSPVILHPKNNITLDKVIIHDNASDAIQTYDNTNLVVKNSWLYNSVRSAATNRSWNECNHPDGIQVITNHATDKLTIKDSVFGPFLYHGLIIGSASSNGTISNVLFDHPTTTTVSLRTTATNWTFDHVTAYRDLALSTPDVFDYNMEITGGGSGNKITNSIFYGGSDNKYPAGTTLLNNYRYNTGSTPIGIVRNPIFKNPVPGGDFTVTATGFNAAGSGIVSSEKLLASFPNTTPTPVTPPPATPNPTPTKTATPSPTSSPIATPTPQVTPESTPVTDPCHNNPGISITQPQGHMYATECVSNGALMYNNDRRFNFFNPIDSIKNALYIQPGDVPDKDESNLSFEVTVHRSANVYIAFRKVPGQGVPTWITDQYDKLTPEGYEQLNEFVLRKNDLGLIGVYDLYQKKSLQIDQPITFGPASTSTNTAYSMYLVLIAPL